MKFTGKTDIDATLNATFAAFADFETFERLARQSGTEVARTDDMTSPGCGMMWDIRARYKGKLRKITAELVDFDPPDSLDFAASTGGFDAAIRIDLIVLSARQTRASVTFDVRARSLGARILLQSARLTKGRLARRFEKRLHRFGRDLARRIQLD